MSNYPEHDKLHAIKTQSQALGTFLEWLEQERGVELAIRHQHTHDCLETHECAEDKIEDDWSICSDEWAYKCEVDCEGYALLPWNRRIEDILADYFEIDLRKLEDEKRAMLDLIRAGN